MFLFLMMIGFAGGVTFTQTPCCPYIDSIVVIPANPTDQDLIRVVTRTTTPALGHQIHFLQYLSNDTIHLEGCFFSGMLTAIQTYLDTTLIGPLPAGTYTIHYTGIISNEPERCTIVQFQTMTKELVITPSIISVEDPQNNTSRSWTLAPNPSDGLITVSQTSHTPVLTDWELYGLNGRLLLSGSAVASGHSWQLDISHFPPGLYLLKLSSSDQVTVKKVIRQ